MVRAVDDVLEEIGAGDQPRLLVLNKADLLDDERRRELGFRHPGAVLVSAESGEGLGALGERVEAAFRRTLRPLELLVPYDEGGSLAELHEVAGDLEREDTADGVRVSVSLPSRSRSATSASRRDAPSCASGGCRRPPTLPTRAYDGDAGLDLRAARRRRSRPGERVAVGTGFAVEIPEGHAGLVLPRSGLAAKHGITLPNAPGLIDAGYRGELRVLLLNTDPPEPSRSPPATASPSSSSCVSSCRRRSRPTSSRRASAPSAGSARAASSRGPARGSPRPARP